MNLEKTVRFLGCVSGAEKVLGFVQYFSKILIALSKDDQLKQRLGFLTAAIGDSRMLLRYIGLFQMANWIVQFESKEAASGHVLHATNPWLLWVQRLENLFNSCYFPLEHLYWLGAHKILTLSPTSLLQVSLWSCRCWAAAVFLGYFRLWENYKQLRRDQAEAKQKGKSSDVTFGERRRSLVLQTLTNIGYTPLTIHWSLANGPFPEGVIGLFGTLAMVSQLCLAWSNV